MLTREDYQNMKPRLEPYLTAVARHGLQSEDGIVVEDSVRGLDPAQLPGLVIDDRKAVQQGNWTEGQDLKGSVGHGYLYAAPGAGTRVRFEFRMPKSGRYAARYACRTKTAARWFR